MGGIRIHEDTVGSGHHPFIINQVPSTSMGIGSCSCLLATSTAPRAKATNLVWRALPLQYVTMTSQLTDVI